MIKTTSIGRADFVVEVGAGYGALTKPLVDTAGRVLAVEIDSFLVDALRASLGSQAEIRQADFLSLRLPSQPYKVVGNVPYALTTEVVRKIVEANTPPLDAWLVVQLELAQRLCGPPYGHESLFSLRLKPRWHVEIIDRLRRSDFDPPPSVDSVLLWLSQRGRALMSEAELATYQVLIEAAYQTRGTLRQTLKPWLSKVQLRRLGRDLRFDESASPSALLFEQWLGIVRFLGPAGARRKLQ